MFWKIFLFAFTFKRVFEVKVIFLILRGSSASKCVFRLFVFQELDSMIPDLRRWQSPNHSKWIGYYFWTKIAFDEFPGENRTNMLDFEITIRQNDLFWTPIYEADTFEMIFLKGLTLSICEGDTLKSSGFLKKQQKSIFFLKKYSFLDFCEGYDDFLQWNLVISEDLGTAGSSKSSIFEQKKEVLNGNEIDHICSHRFFFPDPAKIMIQSDLSYVSDHSSGENERSQDVIKYFIL